MSAKSKALFLDRDGIVNIDHGYVHKIEDFEFVSGIFDLCKAFQRTGYLLFVVTNQAGIAKGLYTEAQFKTLNVWMLEQFSARDIRIQQVYYCPHHIDGTDLRYKKDCPCRKPAPGMLLKADKNWHIDLENSVMIGDRLSDMQAAQNAGVGRRILLESRYHEIASSGDFEVVNDIRNIAVENKER